MYMNKRGYTSFKRHKNKNIYVSHVNAHHRGPLAGMSVLTNFCELLMIYVKSILVNISTYIQPMKFCNHFLFENSLMYFNISTEYN